MQGSRHWFCGGLRSTVTCRPRMSLPRRGTCLACTLSQSRGVLVQWCMLSGPPNVHKPHSRLPAWQTRAAFKLL